MFRRLDPGTAGTVGFLIRLVFVGLAIIVALRVAGLDPRTLAVGGAFTAVIRGQVVADIFRRRRRPTTHDVLKPDIRLSSKTRWLTATT